jgi:hypothetical protein
MGKYQQECDYQLAIVNQVKEIERLNAQVAMLQSSRRLMKTATLPMVTTAR